MRYGLFEIWIFTDDAREYAECVSLEIVLAVTGYLHQPYKVLLLKELGESVFSLCELREDEVCVEAGLKLAVLGVQIIDESGDNLLALLVEDVAHLLLFGRE